MPRVHVVKKAQPRYEMKKKTDADGNVIKVPVMTKRRDEDGNLIQKKKKSGALVFRTLSEPDKSKPKPNRKCDKCGKEIQVGMPYRWTELKMTYGGMKKVRCMECPSWKQSELTMSKMSGIYAAQEMMDDAEFNSQEDLEQMRDDIANAIEEVAQEYEDSATNIEDGFGHSTTMSEELSEKAEELRNWAQDIQGVDFEDLPDCDVCDGTGEVECTECDGNGSKQSEDGGELEDCDECGGTGKVDCEHCEDGKPGSDTEQFSDWLEEATNALQEAVDNCPI